MLVLAGGFGTRLKSIVSDVPKPLVPVGNVPFLRFQIENWIAQGLNSFIFLLHHQANLIIEFLKNEQDGLLRNCDISWVEEPMPAGTGGAVAYAVRQLDLKGCFLVANADTWLDGGITEVGQVIAPAMAVVNVNNADRYGRVQRRGEYITEFKEKTASIGQGWINAGLYHLDAAIFENSSEESFSLEQVTFPALAAAGILRAVPLEADFVDIGIPEDYRRFCDWVLCGRTGIV